jgi:MSHA pilin protein MshD
MNVAVRLQRGTTLIELVVAITIISIAVLSVMSLFSAVAARSGSLLVTEQATAIASAYLDEITSKPFVDPAGTDGEAARNAFDDVDDYNRLPDLVVRNSQGVAVAGLDQYTVTVAVTDSALNTVPANQSKRVDVTVRHSTGVSVSLSAFRTRGWP